MITFKEFLLEDEDKKLHFINDAAEIYIKECSHWKNVRTPLWRLATSGEPPRLRSTRERLTKSVGGSAEMQDWIFSLPGWENFPDRKRSIFCSTNKEIEVGTNTGGNLYAIYPVDHTKLAVTETKDFNYIMPFEHAGMPHGMGIREVRYALIDLVDQIPLADVKQPPEKLWNKVKSFYTENGKIDKGNVILQRMPPRYQKALQIFLDEIPAAFSPKNLGCSIVNDALLDKLDKAQHEVWFEGKYLSIPKDRFSAFCTAVETLQAGGELTDDRHVVKTKAVKAK